MNKSTVALNFSIQSLVKGRKNCYMWTLTIPDPNYNVKSVKLYSKRFTRFFFLLRRLYPEFAGVRVYEFGENFGRLHCHFICVKRLDMKKLLPIAAKCGVGHMNVKRIPSARAGYISKYVGKQLQHREQRLAVKGLRRWGRINFEGSKVKDIVCDSAFSRVARGVYRIIAPVFITHRERSRYLRRVMSKIKWDLYDWLNLLKYDEDLCREILLAPLF